MPYKKKLIILLSLIAALALTYTASLVFNPEAAGSRSASYVWLDSRFAGRAAKIVLTGQEKIELVKSNNRWFISRNGMEYPARQTRIDDFIGLFTTRSAWPVRSTSASSHSLLGLDEGSAARITIHGENTTLLDLLIGNEDITGRGVYLRKVGQNEVRSGEGIASYLAGSVNNWYNLRLISETEDGKLDADSVQRLYVYGLGEVQSFSRRNRDWVISGLQVENPDKSSIESYVKAVLNAEGDEFDDSISVNDPMFNNISIVLELGNGSVKTIRLSEPDESGRCFAAVAGFDFVYSLAPWTVQRLFKTAADFERQ